MKKYLFYFILIIAFTGCEEPFNPPIDQTAPAMIIDGMLCTQPEKSRVIVNMSTPYNSNSYSKPVSGLIIYVTDSLGGRINFIESGNSGVYLTAKDSSQAAKVGNKYTLFIENNEGEIFKSSAQLVRECPDITSLYVVSEIETVLTEDSYGDVLEKDNKGTAIYTDTKGILEEQNYYIYKWYGYEEHHSTIGIPGTESQTIYRHVRISQLYTSILCTGNADESDNLYLKKNKFVFIPAFTYQGYTTLVPANYRVYGTTFDGYIFSSDQYSISADAYHFWSVAEKQLEATGKLFDPVASQLKGNISCSNNPDKFILGIFSATDVKTRYDYFYINSRDRSYSKEIDSLPELWIDTCSWSLPPGWIFPPI